MKNMELAPREVEEKDLEKYMIDNALKDLGYEYAKKYANCYIKYKYYNLRSGETVLFDEEVNDPVLSFESKVYKFEL